MYQYDYLGLVSDYAYQEYAQPSVAPSVTNIEGGNTFITTINGGGGGQATGPNITISGGTTGLTFNGLNNTITLTGTLDLDNGGTGATTAAAARANLEAAKSAVNNDITMLNALADSAGWTAPTGTGSRAGFDTSTATLTQVAESLKALIDMLLGQGIVQL